MEQTSPSVRISPALRRNRGLRVTQRESMRFIRDRDINNRLNRDEEVLNREIREATDLFLRQTEDANHEQPRPEV